MALIFKGGVKLYYYLNEEIADARTKNWFLIQTPWIALAILGVYSMTALRWLPTFMNNRPAYKLRHLIAGYNVLQVVACSYVVYHSLRLGWLNHYSLFCQPVDNGRYSVEYAWKVCYVYFLIKTLDLFDTIFFALRKKQNQITFLHVYHHIGMVALSWSIVKWLPGGHGTLLVTINSFVHIIMYAYYLITVWDEAYKRSLWWKKYVTQLQMFQFMILLIHFCVLLVVGECPFPRVPAYILIPQHLFMFILFADFYYRNYVKTTKNVSMKNKLHN